MGNRAGSIPALGTSRELWLNTIRDYVAHMNFRHALALKIKCTTLALDFGKKSKHKQQIKKAYRRKPA